MSFGGSCQTTHAYVHRHFFINLLHDVVNVPGELSVLLMPGLLAGLARHVHLAVLFLNLVLLEGLGKLVHLAGNV